MIDITTISTWLEAATSAASLIGTIVTLAKAIRAVARRRTRKKRSRRRRGRRR